MPDYKESDVTGKTWQRAVRVQIDNPLGGVPSIMFVEETVTKIGDKNIKEMVANLSTTFDANDANHVAIYNALNNLYIQLREARDAQG